MTEMEPFEQYLKNQIDEIEQNTKNITEEFKPFDQLRITTMTLIFPFNSPININGAFCFLPKTKIEITKQKRKSKYFKIPNCGIPGAILSMRFKGITRGIIRSTTKGHFKNSITMDICVGEKNLSIKLSSEKIQMCGATSEQQGDEGVRRLVGHLLDIENVLRNVSEEERFKAIDWISQKCKGQRILTFDDKGNTVHDHIIKDISSLEVPSSINKDYVKLLLRSWDDHAFYSNYMSTLEWLKDIGSVCSLDLHTVESQKAMVNYNYSIGFPVNRSDLVREINGYNGFFARYDNAIEYHVTIELPYEPPAELSNKKKSKKPRHTFLVYKAGVVTQSGPGQKYMKPVYELFMKTMLELQPMIQADS